MRHADTLASLLTADALRREAIRAVGTLGLSDGWIGAGFIRDAVWDYLHGMPIMPPQGDVDVLWFDASDVDADRDRSLEEQLRLLVPTLKWSVKNQARMHRRNDDAPYASVADAMTRWPESATAIAVRQVQDGRLDINAPLGLDDLFGLRLVPTAGFAVEKRAIFDARVAAKRWLVRYPLLTSA